MKKALKRLLCLIMALTMVFALAACGETAEENNDEDEQETTTEATEPEETEDTTAEDPQATEETEEKTPEMETTLVGNWVGEVDMSVLVSQFLLELDSGYELEMDECVLVVNATFDEDGTAVWEVDEDSVEAIYKSFADAMWKMTVQMMAEQLGGVSLSAAEEVLVAQGATKESLMEIMGEADMDELEALRGQWRLEDDQLYLIMEDSEEEAEPATIEFGYGTFSIVEVPIEDEEDEELAKSMLPLVFKRAE